MGGYFIFMCKVAHLEKIPDGSFIMRIGGDGWCYGEPYELFVVLVDLGQGVAEVRGLDRPLLPSHWRAMSKCGLENGFTMAVFERIKNGVRTRKFIVL